MIGAKLQPRRVSQAEVKSNRNDNGEYRCIVLLYPSCFHYAESQVPL